jgi:hypothetical protein
LINSSQKMPKSLSRLGIPSYAKNPLEFRLRKKKWARMLLPISFVGA